MKRIALQVPPLIINLHNLLGFRRLLIQRRVDVPDLCQFEGGGAGIRLNIIF